MINKEDKNRRITIKTLKQYIKDYEKTHTAELIWDYDKDQNQEEDADLLYQAHQEYEAYVSMCFVYTYLEEKEVKKHK